MKTLIMCVHTYAYASTYTLNKKKINLKDQGSGIGDLQSQHSGRGWG